MANLRKPPRVPYDDAPSDVRSLTKYRDIIRERIADGRKYDAATARTWDSLRDHYQPGTRCYKLLSEIYTLVRLAQED